MNALAICIKLIHVRSYFPFKYYCPSGAAMMLEPFERIHCRAFPTINILSKSEWNRWGKRPASELDYSSAKWYMWMLVRTSCITSSIFYLNKLKVGSINAPLRRNSYQSLFHIWNLSRYWNCILMVFPFGVLVIVAKDPIVDGRRPELTRLSLVSAVRCF